MKSHPDRSDRRTETIGQKIDLLVDSVDQRFDGVDARLDAINKRFDAVDEAFAEQRQYTEFAFDLLSDEMKSGFAAVDGRFDQMDGRFDRFERKLDQFIDTQSAANKLVERRLDALDTRDDHR